MCYLNNNLNININIIIAHEHATNDNFTDRGKMSTTRRRKIETKPTGLTRSLSRFLSFQWAQRALCFRCCWIARERIVCAAQSQAKKGAINVRCTWTMTHWYRHFNHCQSIVPILICLFRALFVCAPFARISLSLPLSLPSSLFLLSSFHVYLLYYMPRISIRHCSLHLSMFRNLPIKMNIAAMARRKNCADALNKITFDWQLQQIERTHSLTCNSTFITLAQLDHRFTVLMDGHAKHNLDTILCLTERSAQISKQLAIVHIEHNSSCAARMDPETVKNERDRERERESKIRSYFKPTASYS